MESLLSLALLAMSACQTSFATGEQQQAIAATDMPDAGGESDSASAADDAGAPADAAADDDAEIEVDAGELAPSWTYRGTGYVAGCTGGPGGAGPAAMLIRITFCSCTQLVKDCTDEDCDKCSNTHSEYCATKGGRWLSQIQIPIVNMIPGCYAEELATCDAYCKANCSAGCSSP